MFQLCKQVCQHTYAKFVNIDIWHDHMPVTFISFLQYSNNDKMTYGSPQIHCPVDLLILSHFWEVKFACVKNMCAIVIIGLNCLISCNGLLFIIVNFFHIIVVQFGHECIDVVMWSKSECPRNERPCMLDCVSLAQNKNR